jgi:hypothetical protein
MVAAPWTRVLATLPELLERSGAIFEHDVPEIVTVTVLRVQGQDPRTVTEVIAV